MSKRISSKLKRDLEAIPLMEKCSIANKQNELVYNAIAELRHDATVEQSSDTTSVQRLVEVLEEAIVAYAPAARRNELRTSAQLYAIKKIPLKWQHAAAPYARAEIQLRQLEILCAETRLKKAEAFGQFSIEKSLHLINTLGQWQTFFREREPDMQAV